MRKKLSVLTTVAAALAAGLMPLTATSAAAADTPARDTSKDCGSLQLSGELPAPPAGQTASQVVTIGPDCKPQLGKVQYTPAPAARQQSPAAADGQPHRVKSASEMFDCCKIRMTGLYTTSEWNTAGGRITDAKTTVTHGWNREPWDAGWSLKTPSQSEDCLKDCATSTTKAHADFTYKGIFDVTGAWYANSHDTSVELRADGTSACTFDVQLKHSFIGWNWVRSCS
ncbi:hypothetical protein ACFY41_17585 [Streptomyces syringium]|uniref:hypothetical protein n=1 Tax=Streptomyces syringium TaxID=76729 RepID=UPI0036ABB7F2